MGLSFLGPDLYLGDNHLMAIIKKEIAQRKELVKLLVKPIVKLGFYDKKILPNQSSRKVKRSKVPASITFEISYAQSLYPTSSQYFSLGLYRSIWQGHPFQCRCFSLVQVADYCFDFVVDGMVE